MSYDSRSSSTSSASEQEREGRSPESAHIAEANEAVELFGQTPDTLAQVFQTISQLQQAAVDTMGDGKAQRSEGSECGLLCDYCGNILCRREDIIKERAEVWGDQVYTYDLEIFEGEEIPVYSATNPSANRFDVVRVRPDVVGMKLISCTPAYYPDHSWFPPYEWSMASCGGCGKHLGWGFASRNAVPIEQTADTAAPTSITTHKEEEDLEPSPDAQGTAATKDDDDDEDANDSGDYETCSSEAGSGYSSDSSGPEESPSTAANMGPLGFIGLIVTHTKCEEKLTAAFVESNIKEAPVRLEANLEYHRGRKAVVGRFRNHEARLRASGQYLTIMSLLNLLDSFSFSTRPAMKQLCEAVEEVLHTPANSTSQAAAEEEDRGEQ